ncbi:hypothetical protein SynROS8604_01829 [Synechococcus sp. ROS8604]|nr:hypothetical protein SynROS8604_01829 [Synechococcus sp. ROS8604]
MIESSTLLRPLATTPKSAVSHAPKRLGQQIRLERVDRDQLSHEQVLPPWS